MFLQQQVIAGCFFLCFLFNLIFFFSFFSLSFPFDFQLDAAAAGKIKALRLDLAIFYSYIDACGTNGCSIQINRELRYHGSTHGPVMGTKRNCSPEDRLSAFLGLFSIITLTLGLVNPPVPMEAYNSVKDARNMIQEGNTPVVNDTTKEAGGIVILVFLFLMLALGVLHTGYLVVRGQWWRIQECCSKSVKETDEKKIQDDIDTTVYMLERVRNAREEIKSKLAEKHAGRANKMRNSRKSFIAVSASEEDVSSMNASKKDDGLFVEDQESAEI